MLGRTLLQYQMCSRVYSGWRCVSPLHVATFSACKSDGAEPLAASMSLRVEKRNQKRLHIDSVVAHAGIDANCENSALAPPLCMASTYTRPADGAYKLSDCVYTRCDNPTRLLLEHEMGQLEIYGSEQSAPSTISCAFASGMMAVSSIILTHANPLCVILPKNLYHGVPTLLYQVFSRFDVGLKVIDIRNEGQLSQALQEQPPEMNVIVWLETPSNPLCDIIDIASTCQLVRRIRGKRTSVVVDSTLAPPTITRPLLLGADFVLHSGTKYLGGHSDALVGLVTASPWTEAGQCLGPVLQSTQHAVGGVASTMDSWLCLRGLRTLSLRVERQCKSALQIAEFLQKHPSVCKVHYPGLSNSENHHVALRQMDGGFGGVLSFEMENETKAMLVAGALQTILRATSLGGTESLIEHRASIEPSGRVVSPVGLLRLSVGLEHVEDLVSDLEHALDVCEEPCASHS